MPIPLKEAEYSDLLEPNYQKALKLSNRYSFINANLLPMFSKEEQELFMEYQAVLLKINKRAEDYLDDVYPLIPQLAEHHMIQRMNPYDGVDGSCKKQLMLNLCMSSFFPELDMALSASSILVGNALFHNANRSDFQQKALEEIYTGKAIGGIGITEMAHGSDAVNMKMRASIADNGDITYNGTKIYTTNGPVADYFATYGVTDISNPRRTMMLTLFDRDDEGLDPKRLHIPDAQGVGVGKIGYNNVTVSKDRMIAAPGVGYRRLFRGLTPERMVIIGGALGGIWNAIAHASIFTQIRHQFHKPLFKHQGISDPLADIYSRAAAYTSFAFQAADYYDKNISAKLHKGEDPDKMAEGTAAILAAQGKYLTSKFAQEAAYECQQMMGGRGVLNEIGSNNVIQRGLTMSKLTEVLGGHRNIQLMIVEQGIKAGTAMAIGRNIKKAKKQHQSQQEEIVKLYMGRAEGILTNSDAQFISNETKLKLKMAMTKLTTAASEKNMIEMDAYGRALPRILGQAEKEIYKAKK